MSAEGRRPGPAHDPGRLTAALALLNRARGLDPSDDERPLALLAGFEALLDARSGAAPDPDADDALAELRATLSLEAPEEGSFALHEVFEPVLDRMIEARLDAPETRLAAYGSLQPGEANHHHVAMLGGRWIEGTVRGTLHDRGWGAGQGFPGLVWRPEGPEVSVRVLSSSRLPRAWGRLDAFEGAAYRRILVPVQTSEGTLVCNLYALSPTA